MGSEDDVRPEPAHDVRYRGLLVDWGGVMTSNVFDAFRAFCELEGLEPDELGRRFREDTISRELLIALETGASPLLTADDL